ncbi:hypothetical protein BDY19DRAFT_932604 [Irpex rosettiformis]|uniref:Uncharacterized protein n=1 Tax=Irpex rosettiformis TaxID=378272 RepID=A0ACB8U9N8_9APHY|nr:hypothetical protein BDY19DRAFT_932604 [Irpex rosettiformis]
MLRTISVGRCWTGVVLRSAPPTASSWTDDGTEVFRSLGRGVAPRMRDFVNGLMRILSLAMVVSDNVGVSVLSMAGGESVDDG